MTKAERQLWFDAVCCALNYTNRRYDVALTFYNEWMLDLFYGGRRKS